MIGIISRTEGEGSGAEIMLCHLLANWKNDNSLVVITARNSSVARIAKLYNIQVVELSFTPHKIWPNLKAVERSLALLKSLKLVHAWNSKSFELGWYISKRLAIPLTCTMHDHPLSSYFTGGKLWRMKSVANRSVGMVAVSNILAEECEKNGYKCQIAVIHNGLPNIKYNKRSNKQQRIDIGFLGMNSEVKGFDIVANWIKKSSPYKNVHWNLYGTIHVKNNILLDELDESGFENFTAWGRQKPEIIFPQIDILVHTSTVFDCYPTVLLESVRSGVPAIASAKGGAGEIIRHGTTGFLFDPGCPEDGYQHLINLINDKELCTHLSNAAIEDFGTYFEISQMVREYYSFWMERISSML